ncbi:MAG: putative membrane-associated protein [Parcubacteria group bacterium Gr01-1014_46]|nr:MAG: putative membrane-associated protein [Parcubacteria group bacterium Gr01-1014_46]
MFASPAELIGILEHYKYWIIFPIAIFEGPIIIIISGFLVSLGYLNGVIAYIVVVVADMIGDSLYYSIGKYWGKASWIKKVGKFVGYDENSEKFLEEHFKKHKVKTFLIGKVTHGLGGSVQIASGIGKVKYSEFFVLSLLGTVPKALFLILLGYFAGSYYERINGYLHNIALVTISIFVLVLFFVISRKIQSNFLKSKD